MTIDLDRYRRTIKPIVKLFVERQVSKKSKSEIAGAISLATECPIIAVCYYMAELYGMDLELNTLLNALIAFYHVDEVVNQEEIYSHGN